MHTYTTAVSTVIPTYNGQHLLQKQLPVVLKALRSGDELVLVDDASTDETIPWCIQTFTTDIEEHAQYSMYRGAWEFEGRSGPVLCICFKKNVRFAAACNAGVGHSAHSLIFLLNNDVYPQPDVLQKLLPHFDDTQVFAVGCMEYQGSEKSDPGSGKNILFFARGLFQHNRAPQLTRGETAWASGGSALFSKEKWKKLGGFDAAFYPAYWEDIDLSFRARKKGWKVLFEPSAIVFHKHETSNATVFGQAKIELMSWRHAFVFTWKHSSFLQKLLFVAWLPWWLWQYTKTWYKTQKLVD